MRKAVLCLLLVLGLSACTVTPKTRTLLLPDPEEAASVQTERTEGYEVQRIYARKVSGNSPFRNFIHFQEEPYKISYLGMTEKGQVCQVEMDYRYGFYETEALPEEDGIYSYYAQLSDFYGNPEWREDSLSPDGRYGFYIDMLNAHTGAALWLMDLSTGEATCLLNGDEDSMSDEFYHILAAWDRDSSLLCYGYFPRTKEVWESGGREKCVLHFLDLESGEEIMPLDFGRDYGWPWEQAEPEIISLYVDREGDSILTGMVVPDEYGDDFTATLFFQEGSEGGQAEQVEPWSGLVFSAEVSDNVLYLDAEHGLCYGVVQRESRHLALFNLKDGQRDMSILGQPGADMEVKALTVPEEGVLITAEQPRSIGGGTDICLYLYGDGAVSRQVLYTGIGHVFRLEYDPVYRRLLADTSEERHLGIAYENFEREALILEF